jgi:hypothetical protein
VGIFAGIVLLFQSPVTLAVSQADFSLPSPHPKIPFPAVGLTAVQTGRFCGDFRRYLSALSVSGDICGLSGRFQPPVSASKNSVPRSRVAVAKANGELGNLGILWGQNGPFEPGPYLSRVQSEGFELLAPFCRSITKSLDSDTSWQTPFDCSAHEIWCEKRE